MRKILMLAYIFPPFWSVGGSIRIVKFIKYLPALHWAPVVLTIDDSKEYAALRKQGSETLLKDTPVQMKIYRTISGEPSLMFLEKERKFGERNWLAALIVKIFGGARRWVFRVFFLPDRYLAWLPFALIHGRQIIRNEEIDIIYATCPPHSVALIGSLLKLITGKPLILDFKDDWIGTPWYRLKPRIIQWLELWMEKWVVKKCDKLILVTDWSINTFRSRYPKEAEGKFVFISNGCDLDDFKTLKQDIKERSDARFNIVHTGMMSDTPGSSRNPVPFFQALLRIRQSHPKIAKNLKLLLIGQMSKSFSDVVKAKGLSDIIKELGNLPHDECIRLMTTADMLLAINSDDLPSAIPGKIYEYWAIGGPPILLLSNPGAAQSLVEKNKLGIVVQPYDIEGIQHAILNVYHRREMGDPIQVNTAGIEEYDRKVLTIKLVQTLSVVIGS
jgi:glycosyltransferase involved in cell wall biosynthesis